MKSLITILFLSLFVVQVSSQNNGKNDSHAPAQTMIVKIDGSQNTWPKGEIENTAGQSSQALGTENVTFSATSEGIFVSILNGANKIKLFALTGQLLLNGELKQGSFFIPTRKGIYFLRVNNKSFKVICK